MADISSNCPQCGRSNWHNVWLCRECGYPDFEQWSSHVLNGYIKPKTQAGRDLASRVRRKAKAVR